VESGPDWARSGGSRGRVAELDCKETFRNYIGCQKTAVVGPAEGKEKVFIATSLQACLVGIEVGIYA